MSQSAERAFVVSPVSPRRWYFLIVLGVAATWWGFWPSHFGPLLRACVPRFRCALVPR